MKATNFFNIKYFIFNFRVARLPAIEFYICFKKHLK